MSKKRELANAKLGDHVSFNYNGNCRVCWAEMSGRLTGTYMAHQGSFDVIELDSLFVCSSCGNEHTTLMIPCDGWSNMANFVQFTSKHTVTA